MTLEAKTLYFKKIIGRYKKAGKKEKGTILNEFIQVCGYSRNYAIRKLNGQVAMESKKRGRKAYYDLHVVFHLVALWKAMRRMCSKRMKAALPIWMNYYEHPRFTDEIREKLLEMSPSTMDRLLRPYKNEWKKGKSATESSYLKTRIPIELLDSKVTKPGFIEADTVAHCGNSLVGKFAYTLTMTDLYSAWTENRATWTKSSKEVLHKIAEVRGELPFKLKCFACDNGSEFLTYETLKYFSDNNAGKVKFIRRRPYKKNDNAHVEQKNDTHVRQLFGYARHDTHELISLMNDIYQNYWGPLNNFFFPVMKLKKKVRIGARIKKIYDDPKTPYQRLMDSDGLTEAEKSNLELTMKALNPITLKTTLDEKMKLFSTTLTPEQKRGGAFLESA